MARTLRDTVSLEKIVKQMLDDQSTSENLTTPEDVAAAVGHRRYFFKEEVDEVKNKIWAATYRRLDAISQEAESLYADEEDSVEEDALV